MMQEAILTTHCCTLTWRCCVQLQLAAIVLKKVPSKPPVLIGCKVSYAYFDGKRMISAEKCLTDLSEGRRQRRQLQLENCTSAEIEEILKVVQHKSLRQVEQEALKAFGNDKERALVTLK